MSCRVSALRTLIVFIALSGIACGQNLIEVGLGIRGGLLANTSFQANRLCTDAGCVFVSPSFTPDKLYGTVGPAVNMLIHDRAEIRFEAVHRRFGYRVASDFSVPRILEQHSLATTRGKLWNIPFLQPITSLPAAFGRSLEAG
jgi:hypothetical protein